MIERYEAKNIYWRIWLTFRGWARATLLLARQKALCQIRLVQAESQAGDLTEQARQVIYHHSEALQTILAVSP